MASQPFLDLRMLVGGVVVDDGVDRLALRVIRFYLFQVPPYARARLRFMALRHRASATSLTLLNRKMLRAKLRRMERMVGLLRTRLASSCMETSSTWWTRFSTPQWPRVAAA